MEKIIAYCRQRGIRVPHRRRAGVQLPNVQLAAANGFAHEPAGRLVQVSLPLR